MTASASISVKHGDFDMRGYEVVRTQFFSSASITSMSISQRGIRFGSACVRKFCGTEYIELLVHPQNLIIAVKPCSEQNKDAIRWAKICDETISIRQVSGSAFIKTLYELFDWNLDLRYRLRGRVLRSASEIVALFDVCIPEIFTSRYDMKMPWASDFGEGYYSYRKSKLPDVAFFDALTDYNNEPDLQPTLPETASENARLLIDQFKNNGGFSCDGADILTYSC